MAKIDSTLTNLYQSIREQRQRPPIPFNAYMELAVTKPNIVFRDVFGMFYDMIHTYIDGGVDEYPDDPESINYVYYDCGELFEEGADHPFFADRLFANRLVNLVSSFKQGVLQNRIYVFEGPHGSGKSTFLNNLLMKFEQYTKTNEGASYEIIWRIDKEALGPLPEPHTEALLSQLRSLINDSPSGPNRASDISQINSSTKTFLEVPCPSHDNPLLLIPRKNRRDFLNQLIKDKEFKKKLLTEKQYEWIFKDNPCTICMSLHETLLDLLGSPERVFSMIYARRYQFNRRLGEGISVFNPGDRSAKTNVITNQLLQNQLNSLLRDSNRVKYIYSRYAKTNNGVYALMDIKDHNKERFSDLHGIISEGVHKVEDIEENVNSLFLALMNPEDQEAITDTQSFSDRILYIKIPYVLDYNTEVNIYRNTFGDKIDNVFLPRVLQNFSKVIISSRLKEKSEALTEWIGDREKYRPYCDDNLLLLKMDIYTGLIPPWLRDEDRKQFTAKRRRSIIAESEYEGNKGFSGRDSLKIFHEFYSTYAKKNDLITMAMVCNFFKKCRSDLKEAIPDGFLDSLTRHYNYTVLQEVKEALYYYNEERISRDIQNYLFAVNFEPGVTVSCVYTGEYLDITEDLFEGIEHWFIGMGSNDEQRNSFRKEIQQLYTSRTLTQEMLAEGKDLKDTEIYGLLHDKYVHNLKEKVMDPFLTNDNFRSAIKDYGTDDFKAYDKRIKEEVSFLMQNLKNKYNYTEQGAREVCIYVIDNDLATTFSSH